MVAELAEEEEDILKLSVMFDKQGIGMEPMVVVIVLALVVDILTL